MNSVIDTKFLSLVKNKIYNDFNAILYKEFNETLDDINYIFGYKEDHLYLSLEEAFEEGGAREMRNEIEYIIGLLKFFYNKTKSNDYYDEYDLFYYYSKKYYKPRKRRNFFNDERQLNLEFN